jgi:hypothetical protein
MSIALDGCSSWIGPSPGSITGSYGNCGHAAMEVILIALVVIIVVLSGLSQKRSNCATVLAAVARQACSSEMVACERRAAAAGSRHVRLEQAFTFAALRSADGCAVLWRSGNPSAVNTPPDAVSEAADRSLDCGKDIDALLQNHDWLRASHLGSDVAEFVYTASRAVHVAHINRDPRYAAFMPVNSECNTSLHPILQIFIPSDIACSNGNFHCYPPVSVVRSLKGNHVANLRSDESRLFAIRAANRCLKGRREEHYRAATGRPINWSKAFLRVGNALGVV